MKKAAIVCLSILIIIPVTADPVLARHIEFINSGQEMGSIDSNELVLADLDGDGDLDAFVANDGPNEVWWNDGNGNFSDSGQKMGDAGSRGMALGDLDGDGDLDAFVANVLPNGGDSNANTIWLNDGAGVFIDSGQSLGSGSSYSVALGDLDNDGDLDAFVGNYGNLYIDTNFIGNYNYFYGGGPNTVWWNDGAGNFSDSGQSLGNANSMCVALADLDNDGDLDAFIANANPISGSKANAVWLNDGEGYFVDSGQTLGNSESMEVVLADVDEDGDIDAFVANAANMLDSNKPNNTVWLNDSSGIFSDSGQRLGTSDGTDAALWDIDGDGDLDAFVTNAGNGEPNTVWWNDGRGIFYDSGQRLGNVDSHGVALGDIDGDNDLDAFVLNISGQPNALWLNQGELILTLNPDNSIGDIEAFLTAHGIAYIRLFDPVRGDVALKERLGITRTYLLRPTTATDIEALRLLLDARSEVQFCIYNQALYFDQIPNDTYYADGLQWNLEHIGIETFWEQLNPPSNSSVVLAILDTTLDFGHPDLSANILPGKDCADHNDETEQCEDLMPEVTEAGTHATHIAGIAAAVTNNAEGIAGVSGNSRILPIRVGEGFAKFDWVFRAIEYAVDEKLMNPEYGAMVINMSLSAAVTEFGDDEELRESTVEEFYRWIRYAYLSGVPIVASMGNWNWGTAHYPAAYPETIAVGAVNENNERWTETLGGSNYGFWLDIVAPGDEVLSTVPQDTGEIFPDYDFSSGTSMAVPHVVGVLGLMFDSLLTASPDMEIGPETIEELRWVLKDTANPFQGELPPADRELLEGGRYRRQDLYGAGILSAADAILEAANGQHVSIKPASYDFGEVTVGQSPSLQIRIENPCSEALHFVDGEHTSIQLTPLYIVSKSDFEAGMFIIHCEQCSGHALQPQGEACEIDVQFTAEATGESRAELLVPLSFFGCASENPASTTLAIPLTATVVKAALPEDECPDDPDKVEPGLCGCGVADTDSDNDGTPDCHDGCPGDLSKVEPGVCGCGIADTDSDNDGTPDCNDGCSNDPNKTEPGACGCGFSDNDSDDDGISDCDDACRNDPNKAAPGDCGCGVLDIDSDNDGTFDCNDSCPNDPDKIEAGLCGCDVSDIDSDNDGTPDCQDECPDDPNKTLPGLGGCGVSNTDSDNDGTPDYADICPNDPNKVKPGICGCGISDADSDSDETPDCNDNCPNDPNKVEVGVCGCGTDDVDSDYDEIPDCKDGCPNDMSKVEPGVCGCGVFDSDLDHDDVVDCNDNCPDAYNPEQQDADGNGVGDACDSIPPVEPTEPTPAPEPGTIILLSCGLLGILILLKKTIEQK